MAAVNWFCLVLAFAFINNYVCIKVDPNGIPNGNYTTINLNSHQHTVLPYTKSSLLATATATTISSIHSNSNESNNFTLLGDTELSSSERTRRLIPYMAFYLPVSELPINKQYASKNNIHANKQQLMARPTATGATGGSSNGHIPIPSQYVHHSGLEYLPAPGPSAGPLTHIAASSGPSAQPFYQTSAGLGIYHNNHGFTGHHQQQPQQQFHLLPPITGHSHPHLQPPGPPGPSATGLPPSVSSLVGGVHGKGGHGNGVINNHNHNAAFVSFKEVNPIRQKTVQHFPPLSSTAATASSASASASYENIRQTSSVIKQKHRGISSGGGGGGNAAVQYRPRTKQSKINLTPFTPSNSVPGNFVPIVYTPVNSNNNNNNILNSQALGIAGSGGGVVASEIDDSSYNQQIQQHHHQQQKPQQIAIEYSSGPLPPPSPSSSSGSVTSLPIDIQPVPQRHRHHQQQQHQRNHHNPKQQSQQYYSVTTSPVNIDLTHDVVAAGGVVSSGGDSLNAAHHHHHLSSPHNTDAISPPPSAIYHPNQHHHQQQPEQVFIDASLRTSQQPQQQQQMYHGSKSAIQFQPPKPESFFDSEIQVQQHHQQQQNIEQVVKDVNSYSIKNSQMMTPQEKYVMYLQQRVRYNKHQQRQQATRQKYRERNNDKEHEREQQYIKQHQQQQQNPSQIFVLSSTISPPTLTHISPGTVTALAPIRPSQQSQLPHIPPPPQQQQPYDPNYPQHSPIHHDLYPRPIIKPLTTGAGRTSATGVGGVGGSSAAGGEMEEQILTIPVHSLFGEFDTLQEQQNHYSHSASSSSSSQNNHQHSHHHHHHKSKYSKNGPAKPQYNDYVIDEPKQSLDDEQQQQQQQYHQQKSQHQLELLKPTLGPPSHAFILVTTAAPYPHEPAVTQENYGSSLRPPYKNKPKIRLQPVLKENNVNYATIREQNPTGRPQIVSITPTTKTHVSQQQEDDDETPKYVYVKEEFGQKLSTTAASGTGAVAGGGAIKLIPSNKYESDDNQIPQQHYHPHHHHHQQQEQEQQHEDNITLQPLAPRQPATHHHPKQPEQQEEQHDNVVAVTGIESTPPKTILADPNELPDIRTSSLAEILHKLQESNHLPHTLTPDNIDNSIKTLIRILNNLKQTQTIVANPPQHHEPPAHPPPSSPDDYDYTTGSEEDQQQPQAHDISLLTPTTGPNKHPGPSTGRPGIDYPNYAEIPQTSFDCSEQRYKGFFGDPETNCQVWHYCDLNGGKASFLCPNGTIFSQIALTCDWWFNVKCATTPQLYVLNERLYKYILPFTPKFPEDYSGPIVDKYLAMKFQEMEEKMRLEKEKALQEEAAAAAQESEESDETISEDSKEDNHLEETTTQDKPNRHLKSHHTPTQHHKPESVNSIVSEQSSERNLLIDDEVDDISKRGSIDNFESTTAAALTATVKPDITSFSLKPIIVSSTLGPDYDEDQLQRHDNEKRSNGNPNEELEGEIENKTKTAAAPVTATATSSTAAAADTVTEATVSVPTVASTNRMQITVEKVDVIEIKPDGATGHLIRDMLMNSKQTTK